MMVSFILLLLLLIYDLFIDFFIDAKLILIEFIKTLNRDFAQEFAHAVNSLGPEATDSIQKLLSS